MPSIKLPYITGFFLLSTVLAENSTTSLSENATSTPSLGVLNHYIPIYSIEYEIIENKEPELLLAMMNSYPYNDFITSKDVMSIVDLQHLSTIWKLKNINFTKFVNMCNVCVNEIRTALTKHVPPRVYTNVQMIITGFGIDFGNYQEYVMINNNTLLFELLRTGNYTDASIQYALDIINKTESDIVDIILPMLIGEIVNFPLPQLLSYFKSELIYIFSNLKDSIFKIPSNEAFSAMLKYFTDTINNEIIWATAISPTELITAQKASDKIQLFEECIDVYVKNVENNTMTYKVSITSNNMFSIVITEENLVSFSGRANYSEHVDNCYTVFQPKTKNISLEYIGNISSENSFIIVKNISSKENIVFESDLIIIQNTEEAIHNLGSPIICNELLYGLLIYQNQTNLIYRSLEDVNKPTASGGISIFEPTQTELGISGTAKVCLSIVIIISTELMIFINV